MNCEYHEVVKGAGSAQQYRFRFLSPAVEPALDPELYLGLVIQLQIER